MLFVVLWRMTVSLLSLHLPKLLSSVLICFSCGCRRTERLDSLVTAIFQELQKALNVPAKTLHSKREKIWGQFHTIHTSDSFIQLWTLLFSEAELQALPTLYQHLTTLLFKEMVRKHFDIQSSPACEVATTMRYEDANAIRYVAGYVCHAVRKKINISKSPLKQELLLAIWELLEDEHPENSESEDENQHLTSSDWVSAINRGGLLCVTDDMYLVFACNESIVPIQHSSYVDSV